MQWWDHEWSCDLKVWIYITLSRVITVTLPFKPNNTFSHWIKNIWCVYTFACVYMRICEWNELSVWFWNTVLTIFFTYVFSAYWIWNVLTNHHFTFLLAYTGSSNKMHYWYSSSKIFCLSSTKWSNSLKITKLFGWSVKICWQKWLGVALEYGKCLSVCYAMHYWPINLIASTLPFQKQWEYCFIHRLHILMLTNFCEKKLYGKSLLRLYSKLSFGILSRTFCDICC